MNYVIRVPSSKETFVDAVSLMIEPSLTKQEKKLLAHILGLNIDYQKLPMKQRMSFIFSSSTKKEMKNSLNLKGAQLSNLMKSLQKKRLYEEPIIEEDRLNQHLDISVIPNNITFALIDVKDEKEPRSQPEDIRESSEPARFDSGASRDFMESFGAVDKIQFTIAGEGSSHNKHWEDDTEQE